MVSAAAMVESLRGAHRRPARRHSATPALSPGRVPPPRPGSRRPANARIRDHLGGLLDDRTYRRRRAGLTESVFANRRAHAVPVLGRPGRGQGPQSPFHVRIANRPGPSGRHLRTVRPAQAVRGDEETGAPPRNRNKVSSCGTGSRLTAAISRCTEVRNGPRPTSHRTPPWAVVGRSSGGIARRPRTVFFRTPGPNEAGRRRISPQLGPMWVRPRYSIGTRSGCVGEVYIQSFPPRVAGKPRQSKSRSGGRRPSSRNWAVARKRETLRLCSILAAQIATLMGGRRSRPGAQPGEGRARSPAAPLFSARPILGPSIFLMVNRLRPFRPQTGPEIPSSNTFGRGRGPGEPKADYSWLRSTGPARLRGG